MKSPNKFSPAESPYSESLVGCLKEQMSQSRKLFPKLRSLKEAIAERDITEGYFLEKEELKSDRPGHNAQRDEVAPWPSLANWARGYSEDTRSREKL